jgi:hypothetical protein
MEVEEEEIIAKINALEKFNEEAAKFRSNWIESFIIRMFFC